MLAVEAVGGILTGSLAVLADAGHLLSDVGAIALALLAAALAARPAGGRRTFGYQRTEVLAALVNGLLLVAVGGGDRGRGDRPARRSARDRGRRRARRSALLGLAGNLAATLVLARGEREDLNLEGVLRHSAADALGSLGVVVAGAFVLAGGSADRRPDRRPPHRRPHPRLLLAADQGAVRRADGGGAGGRRRRGRRGGDLREEGVRSVHDLHVWTVTPGFGALAAHVVVARDWRPRPGPPPARGAAAERFGIEHTTLQMEEEAEGGLLRVENAPRAGLIASAIAGLLPANGPISALASLAPMLKTRLALAALSPPRRRSSCCSSASAAAPAQDLAVEARSQAGRSSPRCSERKGVLTTTISRYEDRIDRLTGEVPSSAPRGRRCAPASPPSRPSSTGRWPELDVAKKRLAAVRAHLKRALVALRERLVAIYEIGTPDVLSVIVDSSELRRPRRPRRIPGPDPRHGRSGRRPRARPARRGEGAPSTRLRTRQGPDRSRARRDRRRRAGAGERPRRACRAASRRWSRRARPAASRRWPRSASTRKSWTATSPRSRARSPPSWRGPARRRCRPARSRPATAAG